MGERLQFFKTNLAESLSEDLFGGHDIVVTANLPYVPLNYQVNEEAKFEPGLALFAERDGVALYQKLLDQLKSLKPRAIFLECYDFQKAILAEYLQDYELKMVKTMLGEARLLMLERI